MLLRRVECADVTVDDGMAAVVGGITVVAAIFVGGRLIDTGSLEKSCANSGFVVTV